jgi:hypothetical protein
MTVKIGLAWIRSIVLAFATLLMAGVYLSPQDQQPQPAAAPERAKLSSDELDSLVAPIALHPDPLLAQILAASTYPLEIVQLQQWMAKNPGLKDQALMDAVQKEGWDPAVQALAPLPEVLKQLADNIKWTSELGNAVLAQQSDVMDAVQRMRKKAKDKGNLQSTEQQKVETKVVESKSVIVIEPSSPEVVYVPSYNPVVVYGPPVYAYYPYPPIYYPPPGYYYGGMAISFGMGVAMGAAWGGGWGWGVGWGGNDIDINVDNNVIRNYNRDRSSSNRIQSGNWQHNREHRGGAPYSDRATANRFGGTTRGESLGSGQARQSLSQGTRTQGLSSSVGSSGVANRTAGSSTMSGDRVGNRQVSSTPSSRNSGAFGGAGTTSGSSARASGSRGASSMGGRMGGGGGRVGGGGRRR